MQKLLLLFACCSGFLLTAAQPNIVKAEYYLDNDPGFGSAINIPVTPAINLTDQPIAIPIGSVTQGIHALFIRSKNASGHWSISNSLIFYKQATAGLAPNITKAEYYFDNDPGFNSGINIPLTPASNVPDINFNAGINALATGIHILFIRSRDANGQWSITNQLVFYKKSPIAAAANIVKAEYYFDTDPGFGSATNIPLAAGADVQNISFDAGIANLSVGIHILSIRSQDSNNQWSITNQLVYYKKDPAIIAPNLSMAEYYFDNDPGFGLATAVPISSSPDLQDIGFNPSIQNLTVGLHILSLRSADAQGKWGITNQLLFYKPAPAGSAITAIEYYYDSEPGFGQGIPIAINPTNNLPDYLAPVNITGLTVGDHQLFMRSRTSNGWSITNVFAFQIANTAATPFININSITNKTNCAWDIFRISFHATGNFLPNNTFTVQLSDAAGSFSSPINIGKITSQISSEIKCQLPAHLTEGAAYKIRVISSNNAVTGIASADAVTIHDRPELGNDTSVFIVCANEKLDLLPLYNTSGLISNWNIATPSQAGAGNHQLIVTNTYGCRDTAVATVKQDVNTWKGTVSTNWHVTGNWSTGKIPTAKTHVIIPGTAIKNCEIMDADGIAASVQVKTAGVIKLMNNHQLFVNANCNPLPTGL